MRFKLPWALESNAILRGVAISLLAAMPLCAPGKAYFASKSEMIRKADAIVVADITSVSNLEKKTDGWTYSQKAVARVGRALKGDVSGAIEIFGGENFICAQCRYATGRHLLFLRKTGNLWTGANWQPGIRPITGDQVSWFANDDNPHEYKSVPLAEVVGEIEALLKKNASPVNERP